METSSPKIPRMKKTRQKHKEKKGKINKSTRFSILIKLNNYFTQVVMSDLYACFTVWSRGLKKNKIGRLRFVTKIFEYSSLALKIYNWALALMYKWPLSAKNVQDLTSKVLKTSQMPFKTCQMPSNTSYMLSKTSYMAPKTMPSTT